MKVFFNGYQLVVEFYLRLSPEKLTVLRMSFWSITLISQNITESAWKVHFELQIPWLKVSFRLWAVGYLHCSGNRRLINYQIHLQSTACNYSISYTPDLLKAGSETLGVWDFPISQHFFLSSTALYFIKEDRIWVSTSQTVERALLCSIKAKTDFLDSHVSFPGADEAAMCSAPISEHFALHEASIFLEQTLYIFKESNTISVSPFPPNLNLAAEIYMWPSLAFSLGLILDIWLQHLQFMSKFLEVSAADEGVRHTHAPPLWMGILASHVAPGHIWPCRCKWDLSFSDIMSHLWGEKSVFSTTQMLTEVGRHTRVVRYVTIKSTSVS